LQFTLNPKISCSSGKPSDFGSSLDAETLHFRSMFVLDICTRDICTRDSVSLYLYSEFFLVSRTTDRIMKNTTCGMMQKQNGKVVMITFSWQRDPGNCL
jgi:hypothetical protein